MSHVIMINSPLQIQTLLDLADNRKDVQTTTDYESLAVVVPDELYERYQNYLSLSETTEPKKRGRPRKDQE